jgi:hypothetical protein
MSYVRALMAEPTSSIQPNKHAVEALVAFADKMKAS